MGVNDVLGATGLFRAGDEFELTAVCLPATWGRAAALWVVYLTLCSCVACLKYISMSLGIGQDLAWMGLPRVQLWDGVLGQRVCQLEKSGCVHDCGNLCSHCCLLGLHRCEGVERTRLWGGRIFCIMS